MLMHGVMTAFGCRKLEVTASVMSESTEARASVNKPACSSQVALAHLYKWSRSLRGESDAGAATFWFNASLNWMILSAVRALKAPNYATSANDFYF